MSFAIMRVAKLSGGSRGKGSIGGALRHLDNHDKAADISRPELSQYNRDFMNNPPTYQKVKEKAAKLVEKHNKAVDEWNQEHPEKKRRHFKEGSSQFVEVMCSYSPEAEGKINRAEWVHYAKNFLKENFIDKGCIPVRCKLDVDEETTHLHAVFLCWNKEKQKTSAVDVLGSRKDLSILQDKYAQEMQRFGLERGYSRYREYESLKRKAQAQGKTVEQYAEENNLEVPKYRKHKGVREWKAEQHSLGMAYERKVDSLRSTLNDLEALKAELINQDVIPERHIALVQSCETYEKLLQIGKQLNVNIDGQEMSITDFLQDCATQDLQRIQEFENDYPDFSL